VAVTVTEVLRLLPGRRLVARVDTPGGQCLLKLFLGGGARRYLQRELGGCAVLEAAGVSTPRRFAEVADPDGEGVGVLFEFLDRARTVEPADDGRVWAAAAALGRLHAAGAWHGDLHLDNFLYQQSPGGQEAGGAAPPADDRGVFVIDGDGVRTGWNLVPPMLRRWGAAPPVGEADGVAGHGRPLADAASLENLAVLCAQRPPLLDAGLPDVLRAYGAARGWPASGEAFDRRLLTLRKATRRQRRRRVQRYLRKVQRACTEFHCERALRRYFVCVREHLDDGLRAFRDDPEAVFHGAEMLKDGNSATVVRCRIGHRSWVVKRYNVKSFWHGLRRVLKPRSRFRLAWCNGQRLHFLDVPTARPVALLERRLGPLRGVAYLVMEDRGRADLLGLAAAGGIEDVHVDAVTEIFRSLAAADLGHGDTKATNFLVEQDAVVLVDLDAMGERPGALREDIRRFLANWEADPVLQRRFRERFAAAGLPLAG
jgi:tRNA A-37 threonylcarbamoyl transferase component Bud32